MKNNETGFGLVPILLLIIIVGLIGVTGWLVWDRSQKTSNSESNTDQSALTDTEEETPPAQVVEGEDYKTVEDMKFTVPSNWAYSTSYLGVNDKTNIGHFILSPDYKESGFGQLSIESGAFISFGELQWTGIDSSTSVTAAADVIKNSEGGYLDPKTIKVSNIGGKQVVTYDSGHTTDGVTYLYKTASGNWLDISFSTINGETPEYEAQKSPHYQTFLTWVESFLALN